MQRREVQRRLPVQRARPQRRARLHQQLHELPVALLDGDVQRRLPPCVARIQLDPAPDHDALGHQLLAGVEGLEQAVFGCLRYRPQRGEQENGCNKPPHVSILASMLRIQAGIAVALAGLSIDAAAQELPCVSGQDANQRRAYSTEQAPDEYRRKFVEYDLLK